MSLLEVRDLAVSFDTPEGRVRAVDGLGFSLEAGGSLGLVGESGAGKSQTAMALLGLLARNATVSGSIRLDGRELLGLPDREWCQVRGRQIAMVFQDPGTSLNPYLTIGAQIGETLALHRGLDRAAARAESLRLLDAVHISDAVRRLDEHPHQLSGGQRQRVMIAMALACRPRLLLADEPTTALDVTVQAQILRLLQELRREFGVAILLITHDLGVVAELCDQTLVMYAGRQAEAGPTEPLLRAPHHPYTRALLDARPSLHGDPGQRLRALPGQPPVLTRLPPGCAFAPRCAHAQEACTQQVPAVTADGPDRSVACRRAGEGVAAG